jgi:hypothetical protein
MMALSLVGTGAMAVQETEVQRIERELDILRKRRDHYRKLRDVQRVGLPVAVGTIAVALAVVSWQATQDPTYGIFLIVMILVIGLFAWFSNDLFPDSAAFGVRFFERLVNIVRIKRRPAGLVPLYKSYVHPFSELTEIEEMIGWREKRLTELKGTRQ